MKIDRIGNTKRGIAYGFLNQAICLLLPFFIQTITIHQLGIEYVGIKGLFSSILTVLSLVELGFGSAIVYSMYKPIATDDEDSLCALLNLYRKIYNLIGLIILLLGLAVTPFLTKLVKDTYPSEINIYIVFLIYLLSTVLSYWVFSYKSSLLTAYQRTDILSIINALTQLFCSMIQIAVLIITKNFYYFLIANIARVVANNILVSVFVDKMYPRITCKGKVNITLLADIKKKLAGLLIGKVCGVTRNSFDSIFIAAFLGLTQAAIYSNYYQIIMALNGVTLIVLTSLLGGIGNSIVIESKEKNFSDMILLNNIYLVISGLMAIGMTCLYQPFMSIWVGKDYLFSNQIMILFPIYFYILKMGDIRSVYSEAAGLFWEDRWRSIAEAIANVLLNYLLGKHFGVIGILIATLITIFIFGFCFAAVVAFKYYFNTGLKEYFWCQFVLIMVTLVVGGGTYCICNIIIAQNMFITLLVRGVICIMISPIMYWVILHKTSRYKEAKLFLLRILKSRN